MTPALAVLAGWTLVELAIAVVVIAAVVALVWVALRQFGIAIPSCAAIPESWPTGDSFCSGMNTAVDVYTRGRSSVTARKIRKVIPMAASTVPR